MVRRPLPIFSDHGAEDLFKAGKLDWLPLKWIRCSRGICPRARRFTRLRSREGCYAVTRVAWYGRNGSV
jgi:hypothetical protein